MNSDEISIRAVMSNSKDQYSLLDKLYISLDKKNIKRTKNLRLIPFEENRRGGKYAYAEWAHVIGIFQTLIFQHLQIKESNRILDVGCGTGLLGIASEPFIGEHGRYIGLDVMKKDIDFCQQHYPTDKFEFIHVDTNNPAYSPELKNNKQSLPIDDDSIDCVTALSVWTHLNEEDAKFYFKEISRVLKKGAKAIITFFVLDEEYEKSLVLRTSNEGRYHNLPQNRWIFDQPCYSSTAWYHPSWVDVPENAIAITTEGIGQLLNNKDLALIKHYQGNWKEVPGMFFQDIIVFEKL